MVGITLIPKDQELPTYGTPDPFRVGGSYREILSLVIDMVNKGQINVNESNILLIRGNNRGEWNRIPDEAESVKTLLKILRECHIKLQEAYGTSELINKLESILNS